MATKSVKQQLYEQLAQQHVQEAMNNIGLEQFQAAYDDWNKQQEGLANFEAQFNAWNEANPVQAPEPVKEAPVKVPTQKEIPTLQKSGLTQEQNLAFRKEKREKALQRIASKREKEEKTNNAATNETLNRLDTMTQIDLAKTPSMEDKSAKWLNPSYKLTEEDKKAAKEYARAELDKFDYNSSRQPILTDENRQHYADMVNLLNKTNGFTNAMTGAIKQPLNLARAVRDAGRSVGDQITGLGAALGDKMGLTEGATQRHNEEVASRDAFYNQNDESMQRAYEGAKTQNPVATTVGEIGGQLAMYRLTEPIFGLFGAAAGLGKVGAFALNQVGQNAQDLALDTLPTLNQYMNDGELSDEERKALLSGMGWNAAGNLIMGGAGAGIDALKNNKAAREAADAAFRANVSEGAEKLARLADTGYEPPVGRLTTQELENLNINPVDANNSQFKALMDQFNGQFKDESAMRNIFSPEDLDASQNAQLKALMEENLIPERINPVAEMEGLEDSLKGTELPDEIRAMNDEMGDMWASPKTEIPEVSKNVPNRPGTAAPVSPSIENEAEALAKAMDAEDAARKTLDLPDDTIDNMVMDFETLYHDINSDYDTVAKLNNPKVTEEFEKFKQSLFDYEKAAFNAENVEDITKAKKAVNAARKRLERAVKAADPNVKLEATKYKYGELVGKPEFRRTQRLNPSKATADDIIDSWVDYDVNRPNRWVRDAEPLEGYGPKQSVPGADPDSSLVMAEDIGLNPETKFDIEEVADEPLRASDSISASLTNDVKERGLSRHIRNEDTPMKVEGISDEVAADFKDNPDLYATLKNADTKAKADRIYAESENPEADFRSMLEKKDPAALPLGHQLAKDYSAAGNHEAAAQIYRDMGRALTESGQFSQAAVINMVKNDPQTALQYAIKEIDGLNEAGRKRFGNKWKDFELTSDELKAFDNIEPGNSDAIKTIYDQIGARLGKEYPVTLWDKIIEARRVAMLFNPRTNSRNFFANPPTLAMRWMSDRVEAVGQNIAHLINPDIQVTQSLTGSGARGRKIATEVFNSDKVKAMLNSSGSKSDLPELKNSVMQHKQIFKGTAVEKWIDKITGNGIQKLNKKLFGIDGVQSIPETLRNATYKLLDLGDSPYVRENFVERLGSYINATGIKSADDIPEEAIQIAWEEAMKATYKDNSWAVSMLRNMKKSMEQADNIVPGLGSAISQSAIPFVQAPGNIAARMVDYSPIGAAKGIANIIKGAKANDVKAVTKGIEEASKGLTGSGLIYLGMKLRESGLVTGTYSENKRQKAFEKQNGFKEFALHIGDKYFTYGWAQPAAQTIMVGTLLQDAIEKSDEYDSDILRYFGIENSLPGKAMGVATAGTKAAVNSWFNESPLSGLADFLKGDTYTDTDIAGNIWENGVQDFAGALIPSVVNATAKVVDTTQRNTYDPSNKFASFINANVAKLPELSKKLPAKYDTWGREMKYAESKGAAAAARYAIPGEYSYDRTDDIDSEINRLFSEAKDEKGNLIQDSGVFPTVAPNSVGDRKLNNKEVSAYQEDMGKRSRTAVESFMASDAYKSMDDPEKIEVLKKIYGASNAITKRDKFDHPLADNSEYKKVVAAYDEAGGGKKGAQAIANYYAQKKVADESGLGSQSEAYQEIQKDLAKGNTAAAEQKIDVAKQITDAGIDVHGYNVYQARKNSIPKLDDWIEQYKGIDSLGNSDGFVNQAEFISAVEKNNWSESEAVKYSKIYGNWKQIPYLKKDGTWGFHKTK